MKILKTAVTTLLAAACLPAAGLAAEITVWQDYDFRGDSTVFDGSTSRLDSGWNDRISSIRVGSGSWELCRDWDYQNCRIVGPGTEEARIQSGWNDSISSLRPVSASSANIDAQETTTRLYRAVLGREPDPEGLRNATAQVAAGKVSSVVNILTQSKEFSTLRQQRSATELLNQIYSGLLGRPADTAARTAYLNRIERGEVSDVVMDLLASDEFSTGGSTSTATAASTTGVEARTRGRGEGVMLRGPNDKVDTINSVKVQLGGDGRFHLSFNGSTPHQLEGTYTKESADFARINTIDTDSGTLQAEGGITLNHDWLERLDLEAGTPGARDHVVYSFVAETFALSQAESACQQQVRSKLQQQNGAGVKLAFLGQQQSRIGSQRQEVRGKVVVLSDHNRTAEYRCQIDRGGQVSSASVN